MPQIIRFQSLAYKAAGETLWTTLVGYGAVWVIFADLIGESILLPVSRLLGLHYGESIVIYRDFLGMRYFRPHLYLVVILAFCCAPPLSCSLEAQSAPPPPLDPRSIDDCDKFERDHTAYAKSVTDQATECSKRNWARAKVKDPTTFKARCRDEKEYPVTAFAECRQFAEEAACAWIGFQKQLDECKAKGRASAERKQLDAQSKALRADQERARDQLDTERCKTDSAFPKSPMCEQQKATGSGFEGLPEFNRK